MVGYGITEATVEPRHLRRNAKCTRKATRDEESAPSGKELNQMPGSRGSKTVIPRERVPDGQPLKGKKVPSGADPNGRRAALARRATDEEERAEASSSSCCTNRTEPVRKPTKAPQF